MYTLKNLLTIFDDSTIVNIYTTKLNTLVSCDKNTKYHEMSNLTLKYRNTAKEVINKYNDYPIYVLKCIVSDNKLNVLVDDFNIVD